MKIYLVYAAMGDGDRVVSAVFSSKEMAIKYCKFWNDPEGNVTYFIRKMILDNESDFINLVG